MKPEKVIETLRREGVLLTVDGNKILASPKNLVTEAARELVSEHRLELHSFLEKRKAQLYAAQVVIAEVTYH